MAIKNGPLVIKLMDGSTLLTSIDEIREALYAKGFCLVKTQNIIQLATTFNLCLDNGYVNGAGTDEIRESIKKLCDH